MEIPQKILDEILENNSSMQEYFKKAEPYTLTKRDCEEYLDTVFGCLKEYELGFDGKIRSVQIGDRNWAQFTIRLYFPFEGFCFVCSLEKGLKLASVRIILENKMREQVTKISYYNESLKRILPGPYIIITTLTSDMIFFDNGKNLKEKISNDTTLFGFVV